MSGHGLIGQEASLLHSVAREHGADVSTEHWFPRQSISHVVGHDVLPGILIGIGANTVHCLRPIVT